MTKRHSLYLSGALITAVNLALRSAGLFYTAYLARLVGAEGVGLNTLVMTVYGFALTLASSGISLSVTRLVAAKLADSGEEKQGSVMRGAFLYSMIFGIGSCLLLFLLSDFAAARLVRFEGASSAIKTLALSLPAVSLGGALSGYFVGVRRAYLNATVNLFSQGLKIALTVLLLASVSGEGAERAILAIAEGVLISEWASFFISFLLYLPMRIGKGRGRGELSPVARVALPLAVSGYVRSLLLTLEHSLIPKRLMKKGKSSSEAFSAYGQLHGMALPVILYPLAPLSSFSGLLVPEFAEEEARGREERMGKIAKESLEKSLSYAAVISVMIFFFSEELGYVVYSSFEAGKYIAFLAPVVPIMYLDHVADGILKGVGEQLYSMWVNIADAVLSVLLVYFLIPPMGIMGYGVVIIVMEGFNFISSYARLKKRVSFRLSLGRSLLLPLGVSILSASLSESLFDRMGSSATVPSLVLRAIFTLSLFAAALAAFSLFRPKKKREGIK